MDSAMVQKDIKSVHSIHPLCPLPSITCDTALSLSIKLMAKVETERLVPGMVLCVLCTVGKE